MGKIILEQIVSADGFVADPDGGMGFIEAATSDFEDVGQLAMLANVDAILLGANTYTMFVEYWPTELSRGEAVAEPINRLPKHVVSNTLDSTPWGDFAPAILELGDPSDIAERLKASYDGDIIVWGSLQLSYALLEAGLVDHLRLRIVPVLIGKGKPLAGTLTNNVRLTLVAAAPLPDGHVTLAYDVARD